MGSDPNQGDEIGEAARKDAGRIIAARRAAADAAKAKADAENSRKLDAYRKNGR